MDYRLNIGGKIYVFESQSEYNKVKEMDKKQQKEYVALNSNEDELQILDDDFEDESTEEDEEETPIDTGLINSYEQQISSLEEQRRLLYTSLASCESAEDITQIVNQLSTIQNQITSLRSEMIMQLDSDTQNVQTAADSTTSSQAPATGTGGDTIVNFAEQYLGRKNPKRTAEGNEFVRVQRGGTCDDFATYVIDNSMDKNSLADWYNDLSENEKAWGPDIFRAAKAADATVSVKNAQAGDLVAIDLNHNGGMDHTAIVKEIKNGKVYTVESNGGSIVNKTYDLDQVCSIARVTK